LGRGKYPGSEIRDPEKKIIPDPWGKTAPDPGSGTLAVITAAHSVIDPHSLHADPAPDPSTKMRIRFQVLSTVTLQKKLIQRF
jgi:hypothetical protein